jgi:hypothetical protein
MKTKLVLKPGKRGTRKLLAEWGKRLVCVRYQYDLRLRRKRKTIELILEEGKWEPRAGTRVYARIGLAEQILRQKVKDAGGKWNFRKQAWRLRFDRALELGLESRLVE